MNIKKYGKRLIEIISENSKTESCVIAWTKNVPAL